MATDGAREAFSRRLGGKGCGFEKKSSCSIRRRTSRGEEDDEYARRSHAFLKLAYVVELLHVEPRLDA